MNIWLMILLGIFANCSFMAILWIVQRRTGNAGIVDVAWSASVGILSCLFCLGSWQGNLPRRVLVAALASIWATRLTIHVWMRIRSEPEDGRYAELKTTWGEKAQRRLFSFYQFQALAGVLFAVPMLIAAQGVPPLGWLDFIGVLIWVTAICGESLADRQLSQFKADSQNRGAVCRNGLWRYSRHPNYFFEWLHWWSYVCFAAVAPFGWLSILAPLLMLHFIVNVTGIPPTEKQALKSRGKAYRQYQKTTSAFFPWFPQTKDEKAAT